MISIEIGLVHLYPILALLVVTFIYIAVVAFGEYQSISRNASSPNNFWFSMFSFTLLLFVLEGSIILSSFLIVKAILILNGVEAPYAG